jgi:hypothetical protein
MSYEYNCLIRNKEMIGEPAEKFITRWDEEHPEYPVKT